MSQCGVSAGGECACERCGSVRSHRTDVTHSVHRPSRRGGWEGRPRTLRDRRLHADRLRGSARSLRDCRRAGTGVQTVYCSKSSVTALQSTLLQVKVLHPEVTSAPLSLLSLIM